MRYFELASVNIFYIKGKFFRPVEPSPPHGYKVGYNDFHLIPPKGKKIPYIWVGQIQHTISINTK